jgi:hypothetical protein
MEALYHQHAPLLVVGAVLGLRGGGGRSGEGCFFCEGGKRACWEGAALSLSVRRPPCSCDRQQRRGPAPPQHTAMTRSHPPAIDRPGHSSGAAEGGSHGLEQFFFRPFKRERERRRRRAMPFPSSLALRSLSSSLTCTRSPRPSRAALDPSGHAQPSRPVRWRLGMSSESEASRLFFHFGMSSGGRARPLSCPACSRRL